MRQLACTSMCKAFMSPTCYVPDSARSEQSHYSLKFVDEGLADAVLLLVYNVIDFQGSERLCFER